MVKKKEDLWYSKTVWTGVAMIVVGIVDGYFGVDLGVDALTTVFTGLMAVFLRMGMSKNNY